MLRGVTLGDRLRLLGVTLWRILGIRGRLLRGRGGVLWILRGVLGRRLRGVLQRGLRRGLRGILRRCLRVLGMGHRVLRWGWCVLGLRWSIGRWWHPVHGSHGGPHGDRALVRLGTLMRW